MSTLTHLRRLLCLGLVCFACQSLASPTLTIELTVPEIDANPYHRPYVAIWLENTEREPLETIVLWHFKDDETWLKDLRQWWRKLGRGNRDWDGLSGATRRPKTYQLEHDLSGVIAETGGESSSKKWLLNIEAVREEGNRSYWRGEIALDSEMQKITIQPELGEITIKVVNDEQ